MNKTMILGVALVLAAIPLAAVSAANPCPDQAVHTYGIGAGAGGNSATAQTGEFGVGFVTVTDSNTSECDGDPNTTADWDGDMETGVGGAFFGYGAWAEDADCNYALNVHGPNVAVNDVVFGSQIGFVVGEDDQGGPIKVQDPVTLEWTCTTSGSITPCPDNDPSQCGPTDDADDCLTDRFVGTGSTCGTGGGDGMYWVFLDGVVVAEASAEVLGLANNPPTTGTITAF